MSLTFFLMKSSSMIKDMPLSADDIVLTENWVNQSFIFSVYDQPPTQTFLGFRHAFLPQRRIAWHAKRTSAWEASLRQVAGKTVSLPQCSFVEATAY